MDIYTYDGKDGTLTTVGNRPAIIYEQKSEDWLGSGFQYAFAEQVYQYTNTDDLQWRRCLYTNQPLFEESYRRTQVGQQA